MRRRYVQNVDIRGETVRVIDERRINVDVNTETGFVRLNRLCMCHEIRFMPQAIALDVYECSRSIGIVTDLSSQGGLRLIRDNRR